MKILSPWCNKLIFKTSFWNINKRKTLFILMFFHNLYTVTVENQMTILRGFTHLQTPWLFSGPPPSNPYAQLSWNISVCQHQKIIIKRNLWNPVTRGHQVLSILGKQLEVYLLQLQLYLRALKSKPKTVGKGVVFINCALYEGFFQVILSHLKTEKRITNSKNSTSLCCRFRHSENADI